MEKEEKIRAQQDQIYYGRLRAAYGPFALLFLSALRYFATKYMGFEQVAYCFVFPISCLSIMNEFTTLVLTIIT